MAEEQLKTASDAGFRRVWIVGWTRSAGVGGADLLLVRLDAGGRFEPGAITLGSIGDERGTALLPFADGSVLVAGYAQGAGTQGEDAFIARIGNADFAAPHAEFQRRVVLPAE